MAGIKVPQYEVFKLGTNKLKYYNWDINITKKEAFKLNEIIPLFEATEFRLIAKILDKNIKTIDFSKYICSIVIDKKSDFARATSKKGIKINGVTFKRFVGTTGGLKNNTLLFVNAEIIDKLNEMCECGRDTSVKLIPAKYEAYKALTCSASQPTINPRGILVVKDCITEYVDNIISLDNSYEDEESPILQHIEDAVLENNASDGFSLCTYEFMQRISESLGLDYVTNGVCLRNAWFKGMLYPFPILEFCEEYNNGNYIVEDIWGNNIDVRDVDIITTESSLKLYKAYTSIDDYINKYNENGYEFSVTKISPHKLDDYRELNYQYLQSYNFTDEDIAELCEPTIKWLKDSMCGEYEATKKFVGVTGNEETNTWQKALSISEYIMGDPHVINSVNKLIKKKINNAKIGKLIVHGNYQIASGDPFALMQSVCGLEITGLLKAGECYSSYWNNENVEELAVFRSPMTSHNNICKLKTVNDDLANKWYKYMDNIFILNAWDSTCASLNGCDFDADILFTTNNNVLLKRHIKMPSIHCAQSNTDKIIVTESEVKKTNKNGMGNQVGTITNRITAMMEVQSHFDKDSEEYKALEYRIACGQLYQQDELDKIKGIIAKPMPNNWYSSKSCKDDQFKRKICADKKPYFMIYVYDDYKRDYDNYIKDSNKKCSRMYGMSVDELRLLENKTEEQETFIEWYDKKMPFGLGQCAMNRICNYVEEQFKSYVSKLKASKDFDYTVLKVKRRCTEKHRQQLLELLNVYVSMVDNYKKNKSFKDRYEESSNIYIDDKDAKIDYRAYMQKKFCEDAKEICPDDDERLNIILDMCYGSNGNKQFCWDVIGDLICKRLEELNETDDNTN